jgi:phosphoserine phosphatase
MKRLKVSLAILVAGMIAVGPAGCTAEPPAAPAAVDPLPSWNDGAPKTAITSFVARVTGQSGADFVAPSDRIAVFDNDGTLWPEAPLPFQAAFVIDELERRSRSEPALAADPMVKAALAGDIATLLAGAHHDGLMHVLALTHAGMTTDEFAAGVRTWLESARHPRFKQRYDELTYRPMRELLTYLRANDFKTFIVSGGGADFMRTWAERVYGIPPEQVVGSAARTRYERRDGRPALVKTLDYLFVDDREGKPVGIHQFIGRRPIVAVGNSDGDQAMLEYTTIGNSRPSLGVLVHHTDAEREYAYDTNPPASGKLTAALTAAGAHGWTVVDMRRDWNAIFDR